MYNKELLETIKKQGKGLIILKRDYKIVLDDEAKAAKDHGLGYEYSMINSVVYDGKDEVKIGFANYPTDNEDFLKRYTNLKSIVITLDEINSLKFVK